MTHGVGFIGTGGLRGHLGDYILATGRDVRIVGGADISDTALAGFRQRYGEDLFTSTDYRELLARDDVHSVFIVSPDYCHEEHACAALEAGKAVFLEKPLAITVEGADRILTTAKRTGSKLFIGHNLRYFPIMATMKRLISEGAIGEVKAIWCRHFVSYGGDAYFKDWHSEMKNTGGLLLQKGAHDLDIIHWLAGSYSERVSAMGTLAMYGDNPRRAPDAPVPPVKFDRGAWPPAANVGFSPVIDVEDHNMVLMQLENGVQASYLQCHFTPDSVRNYTIIGTEGRMENLGDEGESKIAIWKKRTDRCTAPDELVSMQAAEGTHGGADPAIIRDFFDFILDGKPPFLTPIDARNSVVTGVMATRSLKAGLGVETVPKLPQDVQDYFLAHQQGD